MSTTIDDRVVEMRFDNSNFESNVGQTLSTLDRLKLALNLPGATKGLNDISAAAKNVDMAPMSKAIDTVQAKFSALDVIAFTALQNITNSVMNAGKNIIDKFTLEPIRTGFSEYELKMGSVQTIMASTGESIDTVNKYLEELNKYSDQTIYSFSDMTQNIGKFTNAGVDLKTAVAAIKGVSNEAAVSGANANEASRAMYNFAQALSAGFVKLIDWKSIENANMATVEFKNELINTAKEVGTLTEAEDGMFEVLTTNMQGSTYQNTIDATHNFNDSLNYQWMTTEVLTKTLAKYADANTDLGKKAYAAAQDVKTFSMMMDTLKEAAQSGWATTWETIVGDFEEAKVVWTDLSEIFSNVIGTFDDARNSFLKGGMSSSWKQLTEQITAAGVGMDEFENAIAKVASGHGADFTQLILDNKNLATAIQNGVVPAEWLAEAFHGIADGAADAKDEMSDEAKYTNDQVDAIKALDKAMGNADSSAGKLLGTLTQESGREYLFETIKNTLTGIIKLTSTFAHAWRDIIPPVLTSDKLYAGLKFIGEFSRKLVLSDDNADKLRRTLHALFVPIDLVGKLVGQVGGMIFRVLGKVFGFTDKINFNILDYTAKLGDALTKFHDWVLDSERLGKYLGKVEGKLTKGLTLVKGYIKSFMELPEVQKITDKLKNKVGEFSTNLTTNLENAAKSVWNFSSRAYHGLKNYIDTIKAMPSVQAAFGSLKDGLRGFIGDLPDLYYDAAERAKNFIAAVKEMDGLTLDNIKAAIKLFGKNVYEYFSEIFTKVSGVKTVFDDFVSAVLNKTGKIGGKFDTFSATLIKYAKAVKTFVTEHKGALLAIAASGGMILFINKIGKAVQRLAKPLFDVSDFLAGVGGAIGKVANGMNKKLKSEAIKNYAESLAILAGSLLLISKIPAGDLIKAGIAIGGLAGVLILLSWAANKMDNSSLILNKNGLFSKHGGLLAVATSMILLVQSLKVLNDLDHPEAIAKNLVYMGVLAVGLIAVVKILNGSEKEIGKAKSYASAFQMLAIAGALRILVSSLAEIGKFDLKTIIKSLGLLLVTALAMKLVLKTLKSFDKEMDWKIGLTAIGAAMSLILLVKAFKAIANLDMDKAKSNMEAFIAIFAMYFTMMLASKFAGKHAWSGGVGILAMAASLITLAIAIRMLAGLSASDLRKGTDVIKQIFSIFALVIAASFFSGKNAMRAGVMIGLMSGALLLLTGAIYILSEIGNKNPQGLQRAIDAIETLIKAFALLIAASSFANKNENAVKALTVIVVAVGILSLALAGLSMIPEDQLKSATRALTMVMVVFGLVEVLSRFSGGNLKSLAVLTASIGMIAGALLLLKDVDGKTALANATAISEVLLALGVAFKIIDGNKGLEKGSLKTLGVMLLVVGGIAAILGIMDKLDIGASLVNATAISELLLALSVALRIISNTRQLKEGTYQTLFVMVGVIALLGLVIGLLCDMPNIDKSITVATALSELVLSLSAACAIISFAGKWASGSQSGIIMLIEVVGVMAALMGALGGLMTLFPEAEDFLNRGIGVLNQIANGIGSFVGNLVNGFITGLTGIDSLSDIGDELSGFMDSMKPFIDASKQLDDSVLKGVGTLVAAVMAVTAADAINAIRGFLGLGVGTMGEFGQELADFAGPLVEFVNTIRDANISAAEVESVANAASCIAEFANKVPNSGGKLGEWLGENDLGPFGDQLVAFAPNFVSFVEQTKGINASDTAGVSAAATAVAEFAKIVPNEGGLLAGILGDNTLDKFGQQLLAFGPSFRIFILLTKGIKSTDTEGVVAAATAVAEFAKIVPNSGGGIAWLLTGDNTLDKFGSQLAAFGSSFKTFLTDTKGIQSTDADAAVAAATTVAEFAKIVPESGGMLAKIFGGQTPLSEFGTELALFGGQFQAYYRSVKDVKSGPITNSVTAAQNIMEIGQGDAPDPDVYKALFTAIGTMGANMKGFYENVKDLDPEKLNSFTSLIRTVASISEEVKTIDPDSFSNVGDALGKLGDLDLTSLSTDVTAEIPNVTAAVNGLMTAFIETVSGYSDKVKQAFDQILLNMFTTASSKNSAMTQAGAQMMTQFIVGFSGNTMRLPRIMSDIMASVVDTINANGGKFVSAGQSSINNFVKGFSSGGTFAMTAVRTIITSINQAIASNNGVMLAGGMNLMRSFVSGISSGGSSVRNTLNGIVANMVSTALGYRPRMQSAGSTLMTNFVAGLKSNSSQITVIISTTLSSALKIARSYTSSFYSAGHELAASIKTGASSVSVAGGFTSGLSSAVYAIRDYRSDFYSAGEYLVRGFSNGISDHVYVATNAAYALGKKSVKAVKDGAAIRSPSRATYEAGRFFDLGLANAIGDYSYLAERASNKLGRKSVDVLSNTLANIGTMVEDGIDVEPTIRPVLDLSNVQTGLGEMNGMIDASRSATLGYSGVITGRLSDVTSEMSQQEQIGLLRKMSAMMDNYFPQFRENDIYLDTGVLAGSVNRKLGLQS